MGLLIELLVVYPMEINMGLTIVKNAPSYSVGNLMERLTPG